MEKERERAEAKARRRLVCGRKLRRKPPGVGHRKIWMLPLPTFKDTARPMRQLQKDVQLRLLHLPGLQLRRVRPQLRSL